ncbi:adenylate/guanylate cyclase domain-containing protein [Ruegeria lacuscaerulensis]|uniref:adenylate/guanylate cyclase domain-containing protein n=1 Tax=Ruegeria lacuscaerulensis TaxID=55218 RepID=UPI00147B2F7E|nr:adenylate/guanylate cyclase domain-containing protein [Ruegeria lacuscaerulensis]
MRNARLFEIGVISVGVIILTLSIISAVLYSVLLGALLCILLTAAFVWYIYNHDAWIVSRLSSDDNPLILNLCMTGFVGRVRAITRFLPSSPRCRFCLVPFEGLGKALGIKPSSKNPNFCQSCFTALPAVTINLEVGILFADLRGFTAWSESHAPDEVTRVLTQFYEIATQEITRDDAIVEYIGDQIMAIYPVPLPSLSEHTADKMLAAAKRLVAGLDKGKLPLDVGVGMTLGTANVGSIQTGAAKDFTAVGDTVNIAARFQAEAGPRELVYSEAFSEHLTSKPEIAEQRTFNLKGKADPVKAYVLRV